MNKVVMILVMLLLLFNGTGALYGGMSLMIHPDGSGLQLPNEYLNGTIFSSYFIPGLILFLFNGIFSLFVLVEMLFKFRNYSRLVLFQGVVLLGWLIVQVLMLKVYYFLQVVMGIVGFLLVVFGIFFMRRRSV